MALAGRFLGAGKCPVGICEMFLSFSTISGKHMDEALLLGVKALPLNY